jgi:uncharacterized protein YndB with AHSA1/START domain
MGETERLVLERTYEASAKEVWELWTTKDGFESWWGPEGFRVEVQELDLRVGGALRYDMIADSREAIAEMKKQGQPLSHKTRGQFSELKALKRLVLTHVIDFIPGVKPYESTMSVELFPSGSSVRMVVTLSPMHNPEFTEMQLMGFTSQLTKLDRRFGGASAETAGAPS